MRLTESDKRVLVAFTHRHEAEGKHLYSNGDQLDILGMGGNNCAEWAGRRIVFHELGSRTCQQVHRALRKLLPPGVFGGYNRGAGEKWIAEAIHHPGALHRALHVEGKIPLRRLKSAAHRRGRVGSEARLALTLRRLGRKRRKR